MRAVIDAREQINMSSTIVSHTSLLLAAVISGVLTACLFAMPSKRPAGVWRVTAFVVVAVCICSVIIGTLVCGGSQEEIVCYLLSLLLAALTAMRFRRGGSS